MRKIAEAFDFDYKLVTNLDQVSADLLRPGRRIIEIKIHPGVQIEPKLEKGRPINDQSPLVSDEEFATGNPYYTYERIRWKYWSQEPGGSLARILVNIFHMKLLRWPDNNWICQTH